jgi:predicted amidohydrolase
MDGFLTVALLQLSAFGRDQQSNLTKGLETCRDAARMGADIALFPEMWSIGYEQVPDEPVEQLDPHAIEREDDFLRRFAKLAAELEMAIAVTYLQRWPGRPRDVVAIYDRRGALALEYAKVHTCDWDYEAALTPGDGFPVCELDTAIGPVRVGAMICFDVLFPESARVLMLEGAELILMPNACGFEPWRVDVVKTRAIENMTGIAMANYAGDEMLGHSCAFDPIAYPEENAPLGASADPTVVRAGREEGIFLARFDVARIRAFREAETQGDAYRKPATYGPLLRREAKPPFVRPDARR